MRPDLSGFTRSELLKLKQYFDALYFFGFDYADDRKAVNAALRRHDEYMDVVNRMLKRTRHDEN